MIIRSTEVGEALKMWAGDDAVRMAELHDKVGDAMGRAGYQRVYTPHLAVKTFVDLFRSMVDGPGIFSREGDGVEYEVLPLKIAAHVAIMAEGRKSYRDLPIKLFEIDQLYDYARPGGIANDFGVFLTRMCDLALIDLDSESDLVKSALLKLGVYNWKVVSSIVPNSLLRYITAENKLVDAGLTFGYGIIRVPE